MRRAHPRRAIERLFAEGLSAPREDNVRKHIRSCDPCQDFYDQQALLFRSLAGDVDEATAQENEHMVQRALHALDLAPAPAPAWWRRLSPLAQPRTWSAAGVAGLAGAAALTFFVLGEPAVVGQVARAYGTSLESGVVVADQVLREGDTLQTTKNGLAEVTLSQGGSVRVFPDTALRLSEAGAEVLSGRAWFHIKPGVGHYEVSTAEGAADVQAGSFVVEHNAQATQVRVAEGRAVVRDHQSNTAVQVTAREKTMIVAGRPPSAPRSYSPTVDRDRWVGLLKGFLKDISQAIQDGLSTIRDALGGE